ncbi:MAG: hypothetical protein SGJ15_10175 [Bacteroidota bacterium]|nr:hypothetical protein [Bacteroidota bacterium]
MNKNFILSACKQVINYKITQFNDALSELSESANNESKSSAGDKHETSRAMIHLEQEKFGKQLLEWENQSNLLLKIDIQKQSEAVVLGSLIETNKGYFFIATNIGKITVEENDVMVISLHSPLGEQFQKFKEGDQFEFNKIQYQILKLG